ncbi:PREDICTED: RNA polymerase II C-terminal domain phosphatase-like 1 [Populus euphratica]|uniref:protein-serine/threonine phosphatase n=1 Tax=Populus euphratica TaxID=75702 RepID=A0AAJ6T9Q1_POPEU|nr:PREDICTED: RNA polymerase II C-terminal domain phosphatase-like 1 [Populus euphratica]XP_011006884.1 PREDICTED: RNA polymerase II C-terminal domain phosphatase-like 1 [Populus euphratica]XP_011006885.1 PREDICTED: RNA polymerase II C-terminal domain phosphatase-like 1 [Populus euphratica]
MYKSVVYKGEELLGEVEIYAQEQQQEEEENKNKRKRVIDEIVKGIRISHFSQASERCPPLAVLHTITSIGVCFKMEESTASSSTKISSQQESPLRLLHSSCIQENKTAVMHLGGEELHLVAMPSRSNERKHPCFWGFNVASGLYDSCLVMLNLRCLGIVFDLGETLIVANTMRSFEDKIEALQKKISTEVDPQRILAIISEIKRYQDDKIILKQYVENDQVIENGKVIKTQLEVVPAVSDNHQPLVRPLIRLPEKNIIFTRINPQIRDTSVLVRLRPAWEDLRSYLTARGRKRFEVYVCTMAERDYALEMWRLLDPESNLINSNELLDRIVCVSSGSRKSLFNVFQDGICHPKMALVIDDRMNVWDEKDQSRVHVVPAFAPYYAPQAEVNNAVPILCVARNVACNVRGGFFKEFDEGLLQKIPEVAYEDDTSNIPSPPDVSNYLVSEDDASAANGNRDPPSFDSTADAEVERRLKEAVSASSTIPSTIPSTVSSLDPRLLQSLQYAVASSSSLMPASQPSMLASQQPVPASQTSMMPFPNTQFPQVAPLVKQLGQVVHPEPSLQSSPAREEGEVPESELDPDTRRRLLILQHGQDSRDNAPSEPPFPARPSASVSAAHVQSRGSWVPVEEEMTPRQPNRTPREFPLDSDPMNIEKHQTHHPSFFPKVESKIPSDRMIHENQRLPKEAPYRNDRMRLNHSTPNYHSFQVEESPLSRSSSNRDLDLESERAFTIAETPVEVLQEIAMKCETKVEFRPALVASIDLQFSIEAWFAGEKVGEGTGKTRREAQRQAAEGSIKKLAGIYMLRVKPDSGPMHGDSSRYHSANDNGFLGNMNLFGNQPLPKDELVAYSAASEPSRLLDPRLEGSKKSLGSVTALKEFCMMEGLGVNFLAQTPLSANSIPGEEVHAQVEIDGQVLGKGIGSTWDEAKMQAAEKALGSLRTVFGQYTQKRQGSPRPMQGMPNKRLKQEFPRVLQRMPSSARYHKNAPPVP